MGNPLVEVLIIFILLLLNGVFAMSEIAIVSARKGRLQELADDSDVDLRTRKKARIALGLTMNPNDFLSTIQIGITLVGVLAGAFGGATIAEELAVYFLRFPRLAPYAEAISVGLVVLVITYFSLVIGELVPKRIALSNTERIATAVAAPMRSFSRIISPVVRLLTASTDGVVRLLGVKPSTEPPVTEEELKVLVDQGTQVGVFAESEQDMIEGILRLGERRIAALMTPRTQVEWISLDDSPVEIQQKIIASRHSRFPLAESDMDNILGVVYSRDILAQLLSGETCDLRALVSEAIFVPEKMPALEVLDLFKQKGAHMVLVVDEFGSLQGILTPTDLLEGVVGAIPFGGSAAEPKAVVREDGSLLVDGLLNIDTFKEILKVEGLPGEEDDAFQTVAGFVITEMGKIPEAGQSFDWGNYHFEVIDMDWRRVDKILVSRIREDDSPSI
jgi:putative hemolysin